MKQRRPFHPGLLINITYIVIVHRLIIIFTHIAPWRGKDRTTQEVTCKQLRDTPMLQNRLLDARSQVKIEAVLSRGRLLIVHGCRIWFRFGRWRPVHGRMEGTI
jgi:hypothetical protein